MIFTFTGTGTASLARHQAFYGNIRGHDPSSSSFQQPRQHTPPYSGMSRHVNPHPSPYPPVFPIFLHRYAKRRSAGPALISPHLTIVVVPHATRCAGGSRMASYPRGITHSQGTGQHLDPSTAFESCLCPSMHAWERWGTSLG